MANSPRSKIQTQSTNATLYTKYLIFKMTVQNVGFVDIVCCQWGGAPTNVNHICISMSEAGRTADQSFTKQDHKEFRRPERIAELLEEIVELRVALKPRSSFGLEFGSDGVAERKNSGLWFFCASEVFSLPVFPGLSRFYVLPQC